MYEILALLAEAVTTVVTHGNELVEETAELDAVVEVVRLENEFDEEGGA